MAEEKRAEWGNQLEFILTVIGFAVGLGNVWRFPALVFDNGGGPFLVIFFLMLFLVGIPTFFLELSIGQFSGLGPTHIFYRMAPIFQGLGYAALTINAYIGFYYSVIIAYCLYYLILSFTSTLPWSSCDPKWDAPLCRQRMENQNCTDFISQLAANKPPLNISMSLFH
jgi:SNF family Na+-dependent transporter